MGATPEYMAELCVAMVHFEEVGGMRLPRPFCNPSMSSKGQVLVVHRRHLCAKTRLLLHWLCTDYALCGDLQQKCTCGLHMKASFGEYQALAEAGLPADWRSSTDRDGGPPHIGLTCLNRFSS
jgi:hypothetical protein